MGCCNASMPFKEGKSIASEFIYNGSIIDIFLATN